MRNFFAIAALACAASGCSAPPTVAYGGAPLEERMIASSAGKFSVDNRPALDQTVTAELGDTMIGRSYSLATPAMRLQADVSHVTSNIGMPVRLDIAKGTLKKIGQDAKGSYFASEELYRTYPTLNSRAESRAGSMFRMHLQSLP